MIKKTNNSKKNIILSCKKWDIINKNKYPNVGMIDEYIFDDTLPNQKIIGYMKNDVLCFYWGVGKMKFAPMDCKNVIFFLYSSAFNKIKEIIKKTNYISKVGFQISEFEQLNNVVEYMINRFGYEVKKDNGFFIVNFKEK